MNEHDVNKTEEFLDDFDDFDEELEEHKTWKDRFKGIGSGFVGGVKRIGKSIGENPEGALAAGGMIALMVLSAVTGSKASKQMYSDEIGETVTLKKKLTNDDKIAIDHLMSAEGMSKIEAAKTLGLTK